MILHGLLLLFSQFASSTAVIMLKASTEHPYLVAAYRLLLASFILSPFFIRELRRDAKIFGWRQLGWSALPAVALAFHFITWVYAARMTPVANASLLVNLCPVVLPFFLWAFYHEKVTRMEVAGTGIALCGVLVLSWMNIVVDESLPVGELLTLASMLGLACYIALGRKNGARINIWLYLVPMYFMAGLMCFVAALFFINPLKSYSLENTLLITGLAVIPTVIGHSVMNYSLKYFRGQVVSVANLLQPILSGLMGFAFFHETPAPSLYAAGAFVVTGVVIVLWGNGKETAAG